MALNPEFEKPPSFIPLTDLRKERVVKTLIEENRTPSFFRDGETAYCFIPPKRLGLGQTSEVSLLDAKEILTVVNKIALEH